LNISKESGPFVRMEFLFDRANASKIRVLVKWYEDET